MYVYKSYIFQYFMNYLKSIKNHFNYFKDIFCFKIFENVLAIYKHGNLKTFKFH